VGLFEKGETMDGKVLARITIDKVDRKTRKVKAIVIEHRNSLQVAIYKR
jgi:hypothetical protein